MIDIIYKPFLAEHKSPIGAVVEGEEILIKVLVNKNFNIWNFQLTMFTDEKQYFNFPMTISNTIENYNCYTTTFTMNKWGIYWYFFEFDDCYGHHFISKNDDYEGFLSNTINTFQLSIYKKKHYKANYNGKIIYQIMVDRFNNGGVDYVRDDVVMHQNWNETPNYLPVNGEILNNDFFGGDLRGIIQKLDYLKSLNVGIIYLNPIFKAYSNHKYDTGDYMEIDPMFGTLLDFETLCFEAKRRGIKIILDGVFNHTGSNSKYFNRENEYPTLGAYQSKDSPYYKWYKFKKHPNSYVCWWDFLTLPALNHNNKEVIDFITGENGVVATWLKNGASGFRLDVVDELSNSFLEKLVKRAKQINPDSLIIGEVWEDASNKIAYSSRRSYFNGEQLDSVMNYPLRTAIIHFIQSNNSKMLANTMRTLVNNYPKHILDNLMNILGTHDTVRLLTSFSNIDYNYLTRKEQAEYEMPKDRYFIARQKLKMATALLYTLPGLPTIYYGDEAGLQGFKDPFCRKPMPWDNMDTHIYEWYKLLGQIRQDEVFADGEYHEILADGGLFVFSRSKNESQVIVIINNNKFDCHYNVVDALDLIENVKVSGNIEIVKQGIKILKLIKA